MNNDTGEETKWQNLKEKRQHEQLQARACGYQKRREERVTTEHEESIRQQILDGLIAEKGGDQQVSPPGFWPRLSRVTPLCLCSSTVPSITRSTTELFYNF